MIHELRLGSVKLKKVVTDDKESASSADTIDKKTKSSKALKNQCQLTPFEVLLYQIRARNYNLKKVEQISRELKDAQAIILHYIRSRPPLRDASLRILKASAKFKPKPKPINLHEQLMNSIRNNSTPLRKTSNLENLNKSKIKKKKRKI